MLDAGEDEGVVFEKGREVEDSFNLK